MNSLGITFDLGHIGNPEAVCVASYDREFAPLGEQCAAENWGNRSASFAHSDRDLEAIVDVDTGRRDFGQVALAWRAGGQRLKLFIDETATVPQLPDGCFEFSELEVDADTPRNRYRLYRAPIALRPRSG